MKYASCHIMEITDSVFMRIKGCSYKEDCNIPLKELRYLQIPYYNFSGEKQLGELIVNRRIAADIADIFTELYKSKYPIERMRLIDDYNADDIASMADNNTSAFNYRFINGTRRLSNHAQGLAVDINPLYNPYIRTLNGKREILPAQAAPYKDRAQKFPYKIDHNDICYKLFHARGFTWGGDWQHSKDYQHFEKTE